MNDRLPANWHMLSLGALWDRLNDPRRFATPASTIEAIMYAVHTRGLDVLQEAATRERLSRCDQAARDEINRRIADLQDKGIIK